MRLTRRHFVVMAGQFAVAALATACGGANAPSPTAGQTAAPAGTVPAAGATTAPTATTAARPTTAASSAVSPTAAQTAAIPAATVAGTRAAGSAVAPTRAADVTLTLYNAQSEAIAKLVTDAFTQETGIKVAIRSGKDFDLANQIVQEGAASPADLFITENSPAMQVVAVKGLFAPVEKATLAQIPARFSPTTGAWVGYAARATVLVYSPKLLPASALPASIMDLSGPTWKDKVGVAAAGADFQAIVSAVLAIKGADATAAWLKGLKTNAKIYSGNGAVMKAVNGGEIPAGVIYHYYWYQDRAESGANSKDTELYFFPNKDPGGFVSVSGAGTLASSKRPQEAQAFLRYLTGKSGQTLLAESKALEYTLNPAVPVNPKLKPLSELSIPDVDIATLNGPQVIDLMRQAGLL